MDYQAYTVDDFLQDDQFLAYCLGSDAQAIAFWERWQQERPPNLPAFEEAQRLCRLLTGNKPRMDQSLAELEALIQHQSQPTNVIPLPVRKPFRWWLAAASVGLVGVLGWLGYWLWDNQYVTYETAHNQQRRVELPDGSTVVLNSHSMLRHKRHAFSGEMRQVELRGEGYFTVRHVAPDRPFRVTTEGVFDVQVIGTQFTLYDRPSLHRVVLDAGKVNVLFHDQRPGVVLQPGQMVEVGANTRLPQRQTVQPDQYNAWMRQQLVFNKASLGEVVRRVEEQFGVRVRLSVADSGQTFTGILPINQPETVLRAVAELHQLTLRTTKDGYELSQ